MFCWVCISSVLFIYPFGSEYPQHLFLAPISKPLIVLPSFPFSFHISCSLLTLTLNISSLLPSLSHSSSFPSAFVSLSPSYPWFSGPSFTYFPFPYISFTFFPYLFFPFSHSTASLLTFSVSLPLASPPIITFYLLSTTPTTLHTTHPNLLPFSEASCGGGRPLR